MKDFRKLKSSLLPVVGLLAISLSGCRQPSHPNLPTSTESLQVSFEQSTPAVDAYDYVEVTANVGQLSAQNPFTDATLNGWFESADGRKRWNVEGFCDSENGTVFRTRFMPPAPGDYRYSVEYRQGQRHAVSAGGFHANDGHRRGLLRIDPEHRWHFLWEGTGEHYFFNGTTAYWLMGWKDESIIRSSIARLHELKVNRMRVTIAGRTNVFYGEAVMNGDNWAVNVTPWPTKDASDTYHPGFDYTRFDVAYWQKFDRALRFAREHDMVFSMVFDMNDSRSHPEAGSADERRFLRYAVARFSAFPNITWDLGDDLDSYRDDAWAHATGTLVEEWDPYHHLATSHPVRNAHQDRRADWFGFTSFQEWSRNQHAFMLKERLRQELFFHIIPQTNEEYGYEDHYPLWAKGPGSESADTLRRTAWDIVMAGGYQTTGESTRRGTNILPDTGGGWMNGRGDDTMTMLNGYAHMVDFFTSFHWWETDPHDELVSRGNYCLAKPGEIYAVYLPRGGKTRLQLESGRYGVGWFNPSTGDRILLPDAAGGAWISPLAPDNNDWALLLQRK
jgi:hypothetical protein